jgi:hypothetical protein
MNEVTTTDDIPPAPTPAKVRTLRATRTLLAILVWLYLFIKVFVFDLDVYIINTFFPNLDWLINYKFFLYIGLLGVAAALFKRWQVVMFIAYVVFYPLILIVWQIPYIIFKRGSWMAAFAIINGLINFFARFTYNAVLSAAFFLSALAIAISQNSYLLMCSAVVMASFVAALYIRRIISLFQPDTAYRVYTKVFSYVQGHVRTHNTLGADIVSLPLAQMNEKQLEKRKTNLEIVTIANRTCLFVASKMRAYQASRISVVADIGGIIVMIILVIVAFAFINAAIFKVDAEQFAFVTPPSAFTFIYYSFNAFVLGSINELMPVMVFAQAANMLEKFLALCMGLIVVSIVVSHKGQRQSEELTAAIRSVESEGEKLESFVRSEYHFETMDDAVAELERLKGSLVKIILWLSQSRR